MKVEDFKLEHFFEKWEFRAPYLLCSSDLEAVGLHELLALADDEGRGLWEGLRLGYTEVFGHPLLRVEIAALYEGVGAGDVLVFAGAQEAIFALMNVLVGPGDHAIVVTPCYQALYAVPRACGADVTLVPLSAETGWTLDVEAVRRAVRPTTRVIALNVPNSPTGALPDRAAFAEIARIAEACGAVLFGDEVYRLLEQPGTDPLPPAVECHPRGVSLGVMSKAYGLAGLRIGWLATRDPALLRSLASFKHYTTICSSAPSEVLAVIGLRARTRLLARGRAILDRNLERLDRFFLEWEGVFEWTRPRGGSTAFPMLLGDHPIEEFAAALVEEEGVLILPGSVFDFGGNHFRLGFGRSNMPEALSRLERFAGRRL